ncbi:MAG: hypothetical protein CVT84_09460 [Alphaproteobacteria bacterium HGW-Alphaproteobacteria-6]|nr:MAG: hypothetical protein CVT84_09460 [Alphaproteobacteria bacterium HGW-Alphaproteobacteria-6]
MIGTLSLIALGVLGYLKFPIWIVLPFSILNAFVGMHFPAGKADVARGRGMYWNIWLMSLPLQAILAAVIFGIGFGIRSLIGS